MKVKEVIVAPKRKIAISFDKSKVLPARAVIRKDSINVYTFSGAYFFPSECVSSIESFEKGRVIVKHQIKDYPFSVVLIGENISEEIKQAGFSPSAGIDTVVDTPRVGSPIKAWVILTSFLFAAVLIYFASDYQKVWQLTIGASYILGCISFLLSSSVQKLVLQPGRAVGEVRRQVVVLVLILIPILMWFIYGSDLCSKYENLCKPEWGWSFDSDNITDSFVRSWASGKGNV